MFECEDYSSGFHDGFLNKYADSSGPTLDLYISDSLQDMLDIDIRSEIATVVGGNNEFASLMGSCDLPSTFDHAMDTISSIHNSNSNHNNSSSNGMGVHCGSSSNSIHNTSSGWLGAGPSWSTAHDFYADVGACVNPISVMPLLLHKSPKVSLNVNGRSATSPPPASPNASETKSHLTFSPAQMKLSAGSLRNEQILAHIPKQIVAISSTVTAATTAPATLATNSVLQRKHNAAIDAIRKDLGADLKRVSGSAAADAKCNGGGLLSSGGGTNTIKLAPGIGGLTFANSITYNKLKQQSMAKSPQGSPVTANGTIVLKRDRDSSPLHNMATLNVNGGGQHVTKILARNVVQSASSFTPKSIASANSPLMMHSSSTMGAPLSALHSANGTTLNGGVYGGASPGAHSNGSAGITSIAVKPLQQKIKPAPVESEYPKPAYSYSCLIAMALKNSRSGSLPVSEIYSFMCEHFPYFTSAPNGWKNSVRHNLSLNKCFEKIEKPATNGSQRKGCLWAMNPERITKMDEEVQKWSRKDPMAIRNAMVFPEHLEALERGEMKHGSTGDSDIELDSQSEIEETSDLEEHELDDNIVDNMFVEEEDFADEVEEDEELEEDDVDIGMDGGQAVGGRVLIDNGIVVINTAGHEGRLTARHRDNNVIGIQHDQQRDFDIEVEDIYDAIDLEDDKDAVQMAISQSDIIELNPADLNGMRPLNVGSNSNSSSGSNNGYQSPKRARLSVNYSIGPTGELEKHIQKHQLQLHQNIKHIKVQTLQQVVQQQQHQQAHKQQHVVVQTISSNGATTTTLQAASAQQFQHLTVVPNHNRRKMQLVNRIV